MIEFLSIKDAGNLDRERAVFRATEDGNIGRWMVHCAVTRQKEDGLQLQNRLLDSYWFIEQDVNKGDLLVLYSKDPNLNYKEKRGEDNKITHFFYWRRDHTIWDRKNIAIVIGRFSNWQSQFLETDDDDVEPAG